MDVLILLLYNYDVWRFRWLMGHLSVCLSLCADRQNPLVNLSIACDKPQLHGILYNYDFTYRNYEMVEQPIHLPSVTRKLVREGEQFLEERAGDGRPFLLLVSWLHVHTALATAPQFQGRWVED